MKSLAALGLALVLSAGLSSCASAPRTPATPSEQLLEAAVKGDEALVVKLLNEGAEPGGSGASDGIMTADSHGYQRIVKLLVDRCLQIFVLGKNCGYAPYYAAQKDAPALSQLLSKGIDANFQDPSNHSLLVWAAIEKNVASAKLLIERGTDVDQALEALEGDVVTLTSLAAQNVSVAAGLAKTRAGISFLKNLHPKKAEAAAAGGISKIEMAEMMKAAVASAQPAVAPAPKPAIAEFHSVVDTPSYKVTPNPDAYAFVVGVEKYNTLPDARFAERDAKAMSAHLLAMGYPQRNIVLLTGAQATKTGMIKNLEAWLPNNVTERSSVFFYFSGHGAPDANTSQAYLVPADGDPQYLEETAYPMKRLYEKLQALKAKRVVVALDSCFSGGGGRSVLAQGTRPLVGKLKAPPAGRVVSLSASAADEITGTTEEEGHGLFTYQLLKALSETSGRGTVTELFDTLKPRVQDDARRQNRGQTPQLSGSAVDAGLR